MEVQCQHQKVGQDIIHSRVGLREKENGALVHLLDSLFLQLNRRSPVPTGANGEAGGQWTKSPALAINKASVASAIETE